MIRFNYVQSKKISLEIKSHLWNFPFEIWIASTKVTKGTSFLKDWSLQIKFFNNRTWSEIEIIFDNSFEITIC